MEMTYDGVLVMPRNYVKVQEKEMEYVEGGFGVSFYLNSNKCATIATYVYMGGFGITTGTAISALTSKLGAAWAKVSRVFRTAASMIGGLAGRLVVGAVCALAATNMISFLVNAVTADRKDKGCKMTWYGAGFGNAKYY